MKAFFIACIALFSTCQSSSNSSNDASFENDKAEILKVMGQYHLTRNVGDANGTFMIIFKKIDGEWKIIADSSC